MHALARAPLRENKKGGLTALSAIAMVAPASGLLAFSFKRWTRVERQRPVKVLKDELRLTIRGGVEVRENGAELRC